MVTPMRVISLFLSILVFVAASGCTQAVLPRFALRTLDNPSQKSWDGCEGKERCVIAYFAPWCPICHRNVKFFQEVRKQLKRSPRIGVVYIVGYDTFAQCEDLAAEVGSPVWIDNRREFDEIADFSSVPHVWVIDRERNVLSDFSFSGNRNQNISEGASSFIAETLDLGSFVDTTPPVHFREQEIR